MEIIKLLFLLTLSSCVSATDIILDEFAKINSKVLEEGDWHLAADAMPGLVLTAANIMRARPHDLTAKARYVEIQFLYVYSILQTKWLSDKWMQKTSTQTTIRLGEKYRNLVASIESLRKAGKSSPKLTLIYLISIYEWSRLPGIGNKAKILLSKLNSEAKNLCHLKHPDTADFCTLFPLQVKLQQRGLKPSSAKRIVMEINKKKYKDRGFANIVLLEQYVIPFEDESFLNSRWLKQEGINSLWLATAKQRMLGAQKAKDFLF